jgi:hypothetical protein
MASNKHNLAIRAAVMNGLARCSESDAPFVSLGDFLEKLRSMGWDNTDVEAVRTSVVPMLGELRDSHVADAGGSRLAAS